MQFLDPKNTSEGLNLHFESFREIFFQLSYNIFIAISNHNTINVNYQYNVMIISVSYEQSISSMRLVKI